MSSQTRYTIGRAVRIARAECGYTQEKAAELVGVSRQTVMSVEHEITNPGFMLAFLFSKILDFSLEGVLPNIPPNTCVCHLYGPAECRVCHPKGYKKS